MQYKYSIKRHFWIRLIHLFSITILLSMPMYSHAVDDLYDFDKNTFDHYTTGFPLTGKHDLVSCAECHLSGKSKGTPVECGLCHNGVRAIGKHQQHFPSSDFCDDCHTVNSWSGAIVDHTDIQVACLNCHNNITAVGKSVTHIASTQICEDCHNTIAFRRVSRVDHNAVLGSCSSCHNGVIATGKHPVHIPTTAECDFCHSTETWLGAEFDHTTAVGACSNCHNGSIATGKDADHIVTAQDCGFCHTTNGWLPAVSP